MIKEILRLKGTGLGNKKIARALGISKNTVKRYVDEHALAVAEGTPSPIVAALTPVGVPAYEAPWAPLIDWNQVKTESDQGTRLRHAWEDLVQNGVEKNLRAVPYVSFWREFKRRYPEVPLDLHRDFPPGERCEADYKGDKGDMGCLGYIDRVSGQFVQCKLFGNILAFSQLFFATATHTEKQPDFLEAFADSFTYFGGVPQTSVVDNAKVGVTSAHRYDPDFHPEFAHFCEYYKTAQLAARAKKPKDKCFIENVLGVFWRWAKRHFRGRTFHSLGELNAFIASLVDQFNNRVQRKYGKSRRQKFEEGERDKLLPLPSTPYQSGVWKKHKLHPDCHVQVGYNFYSAPHALRGRELDVRVTTSVVEIFHQLDRVACHLIFPPSMQGKYRTTPEHLPPAHLAVLEFTPSQALKDAEKTGSATLQIVEALFHHDRHPLLYLRRIQGILRLGRRYSGQALEAACRKLVSIGARKPRLHEVEGIIKYETRRKDTDVALPVTRGPNPNLRGQVAWDDAAHSPFKH
jgi:transposase